MENSHQLRVAYTTDDDGIHIICSCGWEKNLGFDPTPDDVIAAEHDHLGWDKLAPVDPLGE